MKITKNRLRQIIKEELQNVLGEVEGSDLLNLAGDIARRNGALRDPWIDFTQEEIMANPAEAFSAVLTAAWDHWSRPARSLAVGLPRESLAALKALRRTQLATLKSTADEGVVPDGAIKMLDYYLPQDRTPDAALASGLGREHLRGGGSTNPFEDEDVL